VPAALRVRFLRTACPACWLLDVSRLIASRMVFRAQGESPAPSLGKASNLFAASRATSLQRADNVVWETYNSRFRYAIMTGRSRAVSAAATAWPRGSRRRLPGRNRRNGRRSVGSCRAAERFLQIGRPVPARRPGRNRLGRAVPANGSCPTAGQEPPRSGGSCAGAGQQPPHHSWVLHHPCADASYVVYGPKKGSSKKMVCYGVSRFFDF